MCVTKRTKKECAHVSRAKVVVAVAVAVACGTGDLPNPILNTVLRYPLQQTHYFIYYIDNVSKCLLAHRHTNPHYTPYPTLPYPTGATATSTVAAVLMASAKSRTRLLPNRSQAAPDDPPPTAIPTNMPAARS